LFERLGGQGAIDAFVPLFYEKVLPMTVSTRFFVALTWMLREQS